MFIIYSAKHDIVLSCCSIYIIHTYTTDIVAQRITSMQFDQSGTANPQLSTAVQLLNEATMYSQRDGWSIWPAQTVHITSGTNFIHFIETGYTCNKFPSTQFLIDGLYDCVYAHKRCTCMSNHYITERRIESLKCTSMGVCVTSANSLQGGTDVWVDAELSPCMCSAQVG